MFISKKFDEIKVEFDNKKNSHSYMFYTNDFFSCKNDVNTLIKDLFKVENLESVNTDLVVIKRSEKKNILKEDMQDLKNFFQNTSYFNNYRVYIIEEAHKLNSTTSNMILKFLEEPMEKIIAFFITTNLDAVLSTIKSRCQIVNAFYESSINNQEKDITILKDFLYNNDKYFGIVKAKKYFEKYDRNELIELFMAYLDYCYRNELNAKQIEEIKIVNRAIGLLNNNVNVDYVFDYIFLEGGANR